MGAGELNGRIQQRREQNQREHGEKMVGGKLRTTGRGSGQISVGKLDEKIIKPPEYDFDQLRVNPAAPNPPWDFSVIDFTAIEKPSRNIQESTDDCVAEEERAKGHRNGPGRPPR